MFFNKQLVCKLKFTEPVKTTQFSHISRLSLSVHISTLGVWAVVHGNFDICFYHQNCHQYFHSFGKKKCCIKDNFSFLGGSIYRLQVDYELYRYGDEW